MTDSETKSRRRKALVVGAGIGGLAAAIALRDAGLEVEVYERTRDLREVGAGLTLWRNGLDALGQLGVEEAVVAAGTRVQRFQFRRRDGSILSDIDTRRFGFDADRPALVGVLRPELQRILLERVGAGVVRLDHECVAFEQNGGVTVRFANGEGAHGDLLVGADGIRSLVRASLHGPEPLRYTGIGIWRGIVPFEHDLFAAGVAFQHLGRGQRFFAMRVAPGQVYWGGTKRVPETPDADAWRQRVVATYAGWPEPIPALVAATPPEAISWILTYDREPLTSWGDGAVTLLGDAAHLMAPFMGQGACQALEDAVWLGRRLAGPAEVPAALRAYEAGRRERTSGVVRSSARMGRMLHQQNPVAIAARNWAMKNGPPSVMWAPLRRAISAGL